MFFWGGALAVFALDQITKYLVHLRLTPNQSWWLFTYVQNRGAAFGLFQGMQFYFAVAGVLVIALIYYFHSKLRSGDLLQLPLGLILGGSAGNLIDRLTRHYVVDFIDFRFWPVFNIADTCLNLGVGWLILLFLLPHPPSPGKPGSGPPSPSEMERAGSGNSAFSTKWRRGTPSE